MDWDDRIEVLRDFVHDVIEAQSESNTSPEQMLEQVRRIAERSTLPQEVRATAGRHVSCLMLYGDADLPPLAPMPHQLGKASEVQLVARHVWADLRGPRVQGILPLSKNPTAPLKRLLDGSYRITGRG